MNCISKDRFRNIPYLLPLSNKTFNISKEKITCTADMHHYYSSIITIKQQPTLSTEYTFIKVLNQKKQRKYFSTRLATFNIKQSSRACYVSMVRPYFFLMNDSYAYKDLHTPSCIYCLSSLICLTPSNQSFYQAILNCFCSYLISSPLFSQFSWE